MVSWQWSIAKRKIHTNAKPFQKTKCGILLNKSGNVLTNIMKLRINVFLCQTTPIIREKRKSLFACQDTSKSKAHAENHTRMKNGHTH